MKEPEKESRKKQEEKVAFNNVKITKKKVPDDCVCPAVDHIF